jgi:adenylate cyclase
MAEARVERRLAAILAADVVGYSRLMGVDEEGTHSALKAHRRDRIDPKISEHRGRIVKSTGDGVLVEFSSAVEALRCAIEIQRAIAEHNASVADDRRVEFRIGINVGDVIIDDDDIFGDGVNIAARVEPLASSGGICLADAAYQQIKGKLAFDISSMGEYQLKNIAQPVRVYAVRLDTDRSSPMAGLSDRPSIAVLPFDNMSGETEQTYFSEGITEDIITELSRFPDLFVIARNSTFAYRGKSIKVQQIARDLGVHYVLEGSVRRAGNRVRVTAQLIDAATEAHLWANRFDREITDIFDIQDEIARTVAANVSGRASAAFALRVFSKPPENMAAWEYVLAAKVLHHRGERDDNAQAQRLIDRAIETDPTFSVAHAWKCCILGQAWERGFGEFSQLYPVAIAELHKAIALDPNDLEANRVMCEAYMADRKLDDARRHNDRAYAINPNDPRIVAQRGELLTWLGRAEEGAEWIRTAMQLDPYEIHSRAHLLGRALVIQGRYRDAVEAYATNPQPRWSRRAEHAAALALAGEMEAARAQAAEVLRVNPRFSTANYVASLPFTRAEDTERMRDGLRKCGFND